MGAITLAAREQLDNLIFVINCNLQRLDGPVRGNGQIIQELEAAFRGAGWNVIKVIWGDDWDPLFAKDTDGKLVEALDNLIDGKAQKYAVAGGAYIREDFFNQDPDLLKMVESYSDEQLGKLRRGGHDPVKVYNAYKLALESSGKPTVILAQTIKGYGLGEAGEGRNVTHQQKKLNENELKEFRARFGIPIADEDIAEASFYKPDEESEEMKYLKSRREKLGGYLPKRTSEAEPLETPDDSLFEEFKKGSEGREVATTLMFVQMMNKLLRDKKIGKNVVPIVPDEARTFGMEALFRKFGIYSHVGQLYEPVDKESLLYYNEEKGGAILEEGITEAGSISSFISAGTAYATHGINMIPFFIFYSMFGFQRIGDLLWAAGDARARGFLVGGTSGRTTLPGEGLQHQDGQSHAYAYAYPTLKAYDPAFAYEIAVIVQEGIRRMFVEQEDLMYYLTVMNEFYEMPPMPDGVKEGILRGMYKYKASENSKNSTAKAHLFGSGAILREALSAQSILEEQFDISADVWSVTSYKELYYDAIDTERSNVMNPDSNPEQCYIEECLNEEEGVFVAALDYLKSLPCSIAKWVPGPYITLGTDGYGRSENRESLRDFFQVDAKHIVLGALSALFRDGQIEKKTVKKAIDELKIDSDAPNPIFRDI
jgi:pyruvate dehydrogenase E1 component